MSDDKNYILDPLTCLCKVALLHFMPEKTKLAIGKHVLIIQTNNYVQWFERFINGDERKDISNLNNPFIRAIKWYILDGPDKAVMDDGTAESIKIITHFAILGLFKLQNCTYNDDLTIKIVLQYFMNILRDALDGVWKDNTVVKFDDRNIISERIKYNFDSDNIKSISSILLDAAKNIDPDKKCSDEEKTKKQQENVMTLVKCANDLLETNDNIFVDLMKTINTS